MGYAQTTTGIGHAFGQGATLIIPDRSNSFNILIATRGDTVELPAAIKFIKVDGKVYEIKRSTAIEEVKPTTGMWFNGKLLDASDTFLSPTNQQ